MKKIQLPLTMEDRRSLRAGEQVLLSGVIYTARDAAHKRMKELLDALCKRHPDAREKMLSALLNREQYGLWTKV